MNKSLLFAEKVTRLRIVVGYSQDYVANAWGISQAALSKLENGRTHWSLERAEQAAQFYGLTLEELRTNDTAKLLIKALHHRFQGV